MSDLETEIRSIKGVLRNYEIVHDEVLEMSVLISIHSFYRSFLLRYKQPVIFQNRYTNINILLIRQYRVILDNQEISLSNLRLHEQLFFNIDSILREKMFLNDYLLEIRELKTAFDNFRTRNPNSE